MSQHRFRYPGIQPFTAQEQATFFGRTKDVEQLSRLIRLEDLVILFGNSGSGKTSLLKAGVIPELTWKYRWQTQEVRFGSFEDNKHADNSSLTPYERLTRKLENAIPMELTDQRISQQLRLSGSLWSHAKDYQMLTEGRSTLLIVLDQCEELFLWPEKEVKRVAQGLAELLSPNIPSDVERRLERLEQERLLTADILELLDSPCPVKILISIRSDKLSLLNSRREWIVDHLQAHYELLPMSRGQAHDALVLPAQQEGVYASPQFTFEPEAIAEVLTYLSSSEPPKIEAFQLQILCQQIEEKVISERLQVVKKEDLQYMPRLFKMYYKTQLGQIASQEQRQIAQQVVEGELIFAEEERRTSLDKGRLYEKYPHITEQTVDQLLKARLIREERLASGGIVYELSHDTLISPILKIKDERLQQEKIAAREVEWKNRQRRLVRRFMLGLLILGVVIGGVWAISQFWQTRQKNKALAVLTYGQQFQEKDPTLALQIGHQAMNLYDDPLITHRLQQICAENYLYQPLLKQGAAIKGVAVFSGGSAIAVWGDSRRFMPDSPEVKAIVYDARGNIRYTLRNTYGYRKVAFLPDRPWLVAGDMDGNLLISNETGEIVHEISTKGRNSLDFDIHSEGGLIAFVSDRHASLWDWQREALLSEYEHEGILYTIACSPTDRILALGDEEGRVWTTGFQFEGRVPSRGDRQHREAITAINFSPDGSEVATGGQDNLVVLWKRVNDSLPEEASRSLLGHTQEITSVRFSPDGTLVLSTSMDESAKLWTKDGRISRVFRGHTGDVNGGVFSSVGDYLYTASSDATVKKWPLFDRLLDRVEVTDAVDFKGVAVTNSPRVLLHKYQGSLFSYDSFSDSLHPLVPDSIYVSAWTWDDHSGDLWVGGKNGRIYHIDSTGNVLMSWQAYRRRVKSLTLSADRKYVISSRRDSIKVWVLPPPHAPYAAWEADQDDVRSLAVHQPTGYLFTGGKDGSVKMWSLAGTLLDSLTAHQGPISTLAIAPQQALVLSGSDDHTAHLSTFTGKMAGLRLTLSFEGKVNCAAFSHDGQMVAVGSQDNQVEVFNLSGQLLRRYDGQTDPVSGVAFAADDRSLWLTSKTAWQWQLPSRLDSLIHLVDQNSLPVSASQVIQTISGGE